MHKDDATLVSEIREGNVLAFEILVKRYQQQVFRFIYQILKNDATSEEIVQDAFLALYKSIDRVDLSKKLTPYLFEIAKNKAYSFLRSQKFTVKLDEHLDIPADEALVDNLIQKDQAQIVRRAINKLAKKYQQVLHMYYFDDLSYEEIGNKLRVPINSVRTLLHRGKKELKSILIAYEIN